MLCAIALASLCLAPARASDALADVQGVWSGHIGTVPVMACLNVAEGALRGTYYYHGQWLPIALRPAAPAQAGALTLREHANGSAVPGASWTLVPTQEYYMSGTWQGSANARPIELQRLGWDPMESTSNPCASAEFNGPRELPGTIKTSSASAASLGYRILSIDTGSHMRSTLTSFALPASRASSRKVNASLRQALHFDRGNMLECVRYSMEDLPVSYEYQAITRPTLNTARWLVARRSLRTVCGPESLGAEVSHTTWNLGSGKVVEPNDWIVLRDKVSPDDQSQRFPHALLSMLGQGWNHLQKDAPDCQKAVVIGLNGWIMHPAPTGMGFSPSLDPSNHACSKPVIVPYSQVLPFLNRAGKAAVASLLADLKIRQPIVKSQ